MKVSYLFAFIYFLFLPKLSPHSLRGFTRVKFSPRQVYSPGQPRTRACTCSWHPPTGLGSGRWGTSLHESTPPSPPTSWVRLSRGSCSCTGVQCNTVQQGTRSTGGTASTTFRQRPEISPPPNKNIISRGVLARC